jgi:hypothetical protein
MDQILYWLRGRALTPYENSNLSFDPELDLAQSLEFSRNPTRAVFDATLDETASD